MTPSPEPVVLYMIPHDRGATVCQPFDRRGAEYRALPAADFARLLERAERAEGLIRAYRDAVDEREAFDPAYDDPATLASMCGAETNAYRAMVALVGAP